MTNSKTIEERFRAILKSKGYPVSWVQADALFDGPKLRNLFLGICGYSKRVFKFTKHGLVIFGVGDLYINEQKNECEEQFRCLDFDCPLNKTTWTSYRRANNLRNEAPPVGFGTTIRFNQAPLGQLAFYETLVDGTGSRICVNYGKLNAPSAETVESPPVASGASVPSLSQRFQVLRRDGYRCCICGADVEDGVKLEVDHKVAKARGGKAVMENLWTLCFPCNRGKGVDSL